MKFLTIVAVLAATALAGCAKGPARANCFSYGPTPSGPCSFTPLQSDPWENIDVEEG